MLRCIPDGSQRKTLSRPRVTSASIHYNYQSSEHNPGQLNGTLMSRNTISVYLAMNLYWVGPPEGSGAFALGFSRMGSQSAML